MRNLLYSYKTFFWHKQIVLLTGIALAMLIVSLIVNFYAGSYASAQATNSVNDLVLSNIRAYDVDAVFVYGTFVFFAFMTIYCLRHPFQISYILKSISLFVLIRCVFISLTHIWPYPTSIAIDPSMNLYGIFSRLSFTGDLFFSGHTGLPFLMALVFRNNKILRYWFLLASVVFGTVVLLGHLHYSIDVLAAFFITYAINHIAQFLFKKDKEHFDMSFGHMKIL